MIIAANLSRKWLEFNKPQEGYFAINFSKITKVNFMFTPWSHKLECCLHPFSSSGIRFCIYTHTCLYKRDKLRHPVALKNIIGQVAMNISKQTY